MKSNALFFKSMFKHIRPFFRDRHGATAIVFVLCIIPILLAAGGAVDFTRYYDARQSIQSALDASVLAGAGANNSSTVASDTFSSWNVSVDATLGTPAYTGTPNAPDFTGTVKASLKMYFTPLVGIRTLDFTVTSKAERTVTTTASEGGCVWFKTAGMLANSNETLSAPECYIYNLSGSVTLNSGVKIITPKLCIASGVSVTNNGASVVDSDGNSSLQTDCDTEAAPSLPTAPTYSGCDSSGATYSYSSSPSVTLSPGVYCGGVTFNGGSASAQQTVTLEPGVYILKNATFIFDAYTKVTGTGVTFYFADSNSYLQFNSKVTSTLSAPTSGTCGDTGSCGVLMYEASGLSTSTLAPFNAATDSEWTGDILLPSWYVQQNSGSYIDLTGRLLLNGVTLNSSANWVINKSDSSTSSSTSYSSPRLVE